MMVHRFEVERLDLFAIVGGDWWFFLEWGPFTVSLARSAR